MKLADVLMIQAVIRDFRFKSESNFCKITVWHLRLCGVLNLTQRFSA